MLKKFGASTNAFVNFEVARACMLRFRALADAAELVKQGEKAVAGSPRTAWHLYALGAAHYRAGQYRRAIQRLEESIKAQPTWAAIGLDWFMLAMTHHQLGHKKESREWLGKAIKWMDKLSESTFQGNTINLPIYWHDWAECQMLRREAESLLKGAPVPENLQVTVARARAYSWLEMLDRAAEKFAQAAKVKPDDVLLRTERARSYNRQSMWKEAIADYTVAIRTRPKDASLHSERGRAYAQLGRHSEVGSDFAKALELLPAKSPLRGQLCNEVAQWPKACAKALELRPDDAQLWLAQGNFYAARGLWKEAAAGHDKAFALKPPDDAVTWYFHACLRAVSGDNAGHRRLCSRMLKKFAKPSFPYDHFHAARACVLVPKGVADAAEPVKHAEKAVAAYAPAPWLLCTLGTAHYRAGQYKQAIRRLQESIDVVGKWPLIGLDWFVLAMAHHRLGHTKEAQQWLDKARLWMDKMAMDNMQGNKITLPYWHDWAELQILRREAESLFKGVAQSAVPEDLKLSVARSRAYSYLDLFGRAGAEFARAAKLRPDDVLLRTERGRFYDRQGKWKEAIADYTVAIRQSPKDANLRMERGMDYTQLGQWDTAAADLAKAVELKPAQPEYLLHYGPVLLLGGDTAGYRKFCALALKRFGQPKDWAAAYHAARLWGLSPDSGVKPAESLRLAAQAVQLTGKSPWCLQTLGIAHYRAAEYQTAINRLRESLDAGPNWGGRAGNWLGLALVHHRLGHTVEAKQWLDKAAKEMDKTRPELVGKQWVRIGGIHAHDWLADLVLRREATQLILGKRVGRLRRQE
jgi:tetratricopeptide (TPR) repeat protein